MIISHVDRKRRRHAAVDAAVIYMDEHLDERLSLSELAHHCGVSRKVITVGFLERTGLTPFAYLRRKRLEMAIILRERGYQLVEIAASVGYSPNGLERLMSKRCRHKYMKKGISGS